MFSSDLIQYVTRSGM